MNGGREPGGRAPAGRICLRLAGATLEQDARLLERERPHVDLAELRADFLPPAELAHLARFPGLTDVPVILTLRRRQDAGQWKEGEAERRRLLRQALSGAAAGSAAGGRSFAFADLEQDLRDPELEDAARARGGRVIRSWHDPRGVPADLAARVRRLQRAGSERGELARAVVRVRGSRDQLRLARAFRALRGADKILEGTGEYGGFSAVLAGKLGSWMACCPAGEPGEAAPGAPDPRTLEQLYRFRRVGPDTALYGVVGNPVAHSRSPQIHNRGLQELGLDAVYVPFLADCLPAFLRAAESLGVGGLSVTVPFKRTALRRARTSEAEARSIGAANTLLWRDRRWLAANTDAAGFLAPLQRLAPALLAPGTQAVVLGAGGAARAVVYALRRRGLRVLILNRTPARARALARRFGCGWAGLGPRALDRLGAAPALIVQSTSVGLDGAGDPLPGYRFRGEELVYDLIYGPQPSPLLRRARAAGCRTLDGREMLRAQAAAQFLLFTGRELP